MRPWIFMMACAGFLLANRSFCAGGAVPLVPAKSDVWVDLFCESGDAVEYAELIVTHGERMDEAEFKIQLGASGDDKIDDTKVFKAGLAKDTFQQMIQKGRIELVLNSTRHSEEDFGGATAYAALIDITRDENGDFVGFAALDGTVYRLTCPKNPH